jgi:hypothetical protein
MSNFSVIGTGLDGETRIAGFSTPTGRSPFWISVTPWGEKQRLHHAYYTLETEPRAIQGFFSEREFHQALGLHLEKLGWEGVTPSALLKKLP